MRTGEARAGQTLALVAPALTALALLLGPATSAASPAQDCSTTTLLEPCTTTSLDPDPDETTTTLDDTSTTVEETPTTEESETPTTRDSSETTEELLQTTTTLSVTTSSNLLVPGDGTEGAESTTTTLAVVATAEDGGLSDGTLISLVIVGLVLIAGVVAVLTWRYWVATRPPLREPDTDPSPAG